MTKDFEIKNDKKYPKIFTPQYFKDSSNVKIKVEELYPNLKKPTFPFLKKQKQDNGLQLIGSAMGCGFLVFIIIGILALIMSSLLDVSQQTYVNYWSPSILSISIISVVIFLILFLNADNYESEVLNIENKKKLKKYNEELDRYKIKVEKLNTIEFQTQEKLKRHIEKIKSINSEIFRSLEILDDGMVKKGITEEFFYKYLKMYSDFTIYKSIKHTFYYPDLIIMKDNLVVDLEIDEPYSFDTKQPIHYDDSDKYRDDFFLSTHFIIIRFSEEQILTSPNICLSVIKETIDSCLNLKNNLKSISDIETNSWTYEDAFNMAYNHSRKDVNNKINGLCIAHGLK